MRYYLLIKIINLKIYKKKKFKYNLNKNIKII